MTVTRPRNAAQTRADILSAARRRFGSEGYERTTLRAVAADVGVDAALVIRYFGSKQDLFAAAADFVIDLPDLSNVDPDEVAGICCRASSRCGKRTNVLGAVTGSDDQPARGRHIKTSLRKAGSAQLITATPDHPVQRIGLMAFVIGLAITRYVLVNPPVASLSREEVNRLGCAG